MTNLQAAIGLAQTERLASMVESKRTNASLYENGLRGIRGLVLPSESDHEMSVFWMYGLLVDKEFGCSRDELRAALAARGIETRTFFIPIHLQPIYFAQFQGERYPVAESLCARGLYLPSGSSLTPEDIEFITATIHEVAHHN